MQNIYSAIQAIVPEMTDAFALRVTILRTLSKNHQRIGRKGLAKQVYITERKLRTVIDTMKRQGLVNVNHLGITITDYGINILQRIDETELNQEQYFEQREALKRVLNVDYCWIVPGDATNDDGVYRLMGVAVNEILNERLDRHEATIAVTGGSTLAKIAGSLDQSLTKQRKLSFVPARGGFGGAIDIQSNTVGAMMAQQTQGIYHPLFIPESLEEETSKVLMQEPMISRVIEMSRQADCLLLSIGSADVMADRRNITPEQLSEVKKGEAVGEAFGVFFNKDGEVVTRLPRVGIQLEDLDDIPLLLTIVGGAEKAEAVKAFFKLVPNHGWLICDEGLANKVLNGETL